MDRLGVFMQGFFLGVAGVLDGNDPAPAELHIGVSLDWIAMVPLHRQNQRVGLGTLLKVAFRHPAGGNPFLQAVENIHIASFDKVSPLGGLVALIADEWRSQRCGRSAMLHSLSMALVVNLMRDLIERGDHRPGMLMGLSHRSLHLALAAIHDNPERSWRVPDLAQIAGMSRSSFISAFKAHVGMTPSAYVTRWRITVARKLINQGATVKNASRAVGFGSAESLSRAFKRSMGASPRDYSLIDADEIRLQ